MAIAEKKDLYSFPTSDDAMAPEWPGTPIGAKNTITRQKGRTPVHDKTVDQKPGLFKRLLASSFEHIAGAKQPTYSHDVVIHGLRVRAITNSEHLIGYWRDNWFSPKEWVDRTGIKIAETPDVLVVALGRVATEAEAAYYSRQNDTVIFFNTSYYGQLKSWVLGAVGRKLAVDYGIHSIHGAVVTKDGKGVLYIAPTGTGKSTSTYGLMEFPNTRFHSDDWVYVRYAYPTKDGRRVSPARVLEGGTEVARGYQCYRWLEEHKGSSNTVIGRGLDDAEITVAAKDLDIDHPEAYAYTSEKVFYLRSNLVENFPQAAFDMVRSRLENAPDVSPEFLQEHAPTIDKVFTQLKGKAPFDKMDDNELRTTIGRFFAFENTRAMLDITTVFPKERVFTNPMEPARIHATFLIKRNFDEDVVVDRMDIDEFMARLMVGRTPAGTKEIVYNSYRAVDDKSERAWLDTIEAKGVDKMWANYQKAQDKPATLHEEMEMFRMLFRSAKAYDLNTVLQNDKAVTSRMEAVNKTMRLIVRTLENEKDDFRYTIKDYTKLLSEAK
ncbi:MAG TPA: hypothetical protein VFW12_01090 [Candidatus Limnocylindria bacterium]|nr:hypothetical protein [Candidatus Limnocylindria bacterium]